MLILKKGFYCCIALLLLYQIIFFIVLPQVLIWYSAYRDGKYAISRSASIPVDEQQRMHHYNQLLPGRNIPISSAPGAFPGPDRGGVRMLPSGNNMGIICGINRGMPTPRPGFQGIASPSMLNSGTMTSSGMVAMPNPVNMHSGVGSSQGNSMLRPRENLHMMRVSHF